MTSSAVKAALKMRHPDKSEALEHKPDSMYAKTESVDYKMCCTIASIMHGTGSVHCIYLQRRQAKVGVFSASEEEPK